MMQSGIREEGAVERTGCSTEKRENYNRGIISSKAKQFLELFLVDVVGDRLWNSKEALDSSRKLVQEGTVTPCQKQMKITNLIIKLLVGFEKHRKDRMKGSQR